MDFLIELLFGIFIELPLEMAAESRRIKPWIKTLFSSIFCGALSGVLAYGTWNVYQEGEQPLFLVLIAGVTIWWTWLWIKCIAYAHHHGWKKRMNTFADGFRRRHFYLHNRPGQT